MSHKLLLLTVALAAILRVNQSAPVGTTTASPLITTTTTTTTPPTDVRPADYVADTDLDSVMARVLNESQIYNPANYVSDDVELAELMRLIESSEATTIAHHGEDAYTTVIYDENEAVVEGLVTSPSQSADLERRPPRIVEEPDPCPICHEPLDQEVTTETPCKHKFHMICMEQWRNHQTQSINVSRRAKLTILISLTLSQQLIN